MRVRLLASALGAEIQGIDLSQPLPASTVEELQSAWSQHLVLLFRGQRLSPEQLIRFSACFGPLERHDNYLGELRYAEYPELLRVKTTVVAGRRVTFGQQWHSDLSYTLRPALGSVLHCLAIPDVGGDTLFANMIAAYDALSPTMQRIVEDLECVHDYSFGKAHRDGSPEHLAAARQRNPPVIQKVVRAHPGTGRKAIFVNEWASSRIVGMTNEEGRGLIDFLCRHSTREEFTFRQTWRVGDVLMWDNRATVHMALADYPDDAIREMMRTSISGEPFGRPLVAAAA
ncbi:TauD/TfdA family dioxygenase [Ramlibacter sp. AW1]|uniref:TauD/TfdA family dioxygenase n=1 Tax=Ramlibacter aurantiacus TaxID=2801330 RepID=A0A936ZCX0_9BURK|nr:TauD/TfdA family dioxygenase [Ramlibacter aurantiacus]MBL0419304.1 TauD/TfdA family dioxygenase [Ramlibacter aurantiacus]